MADGDPTASSRVHDDLLARATRYDFFVAVGMLERLTPSAVRVGGDGPYSGESIRFRHDPSLSFSAGEIARIAYVPAPSSIDDTWTDRRHRYEVTTCFLGVTGGVTPLPMYLAEEILQSPEHHTVERDFLDVFHHRLISLLYRIGVKYDFTREHRNDLSDPWTRRVLALAGFDVDGGYRPRYVPLWRLVRLAPLFAVAVRSARALEVALADVCGDALDGATVRLQQFEGGWSPLDPGQRMALGRDNHALGRSAVLGVRCFHRGGRAVIQLGPLRENFRRFLVDGDMYPVVCELVALLTTEPIDFELDLVLAEQARPPFLLGTRSGARLGVDSWLSARAGATKETHLRVQLPAELPRDRQAFAPSWQARPQR
jgi:type VI secretion system protein ImpH